MAETEAVAAKLNIELADLDRLGAMASAEVSAHKTSMLKDPAGRPLEIEAVVGAVWRSWAIGLGVPMPSSARFTAALTMLDELW